MLGIGLLGSRHRSYLQTLRQIAGSSCIGLWPGNEAAGNVAYDLSGKGHNGQYTGVTLGQPGIKGLTCPSYDGATDYTNLYSAALAAAFSGAEGTLLTWARVSGAGVWTDATQRMVFGLTVDGSNSIYIKRNTADGRMDLYYTAGGTNNATVITGLSSTGWQCWALTWSKSGDKVIGYQNGVQSGAIKTGLGVWAGAPVAAGLVIGAASTTPTNPYSGLIGPTLLCDAALSPAAIAKAYNAALPLPA